MAAKHTFVISGLRDKRARLAGKIEAAQRELMKQHETLATLDAVIRMFKPDGNPELIRRSDLSAPVPCYFDAAN